MAFATATGWGQPIRLGPSGIEARLDPDLSTLYFTAADNRFYRLPIARWLAQHVEKNHEGGAGCRAAVTLLLDCWLVSRDHGVRRPASAKIR